MSTEPAGRFITAPDGLRLFVREWGPRTAARLPAVCLPGLARTGADFETLATALADDPTAPRRAIALDSRGRGRSDYDRNPKNYNVQVELADVLAVLTALGIARAVFVGTSRGGILTMLLATVRPTALAGCVLNDIGPVIDPKGLMRIKSYVGKLPRVASLHEAADVLRRLFGAQFPKLTDDEWVAFARRTFKDAKGRIVADYDGKLAKVLDGVNVEKPLPALWKEFDAMARVPLMVIRGGNSDLLSAATVAAMAARHPAMKAIEVPDQGHAPLLSEPALIARIAAFAQSCDRGGPAAGAVNLKFLSVSRQIRLATSNSNPHSS
jgi:pimeloyl-ACP methyl ester carboxylesterase